MYPVKLNHYRLAAENDFWQHKRTAFQDWLGAIMTKRNSDDFIRIRLSTGGGIVESCVLEEMKKVGAMVIALQHEYAEIKDNRTYGFTTDRETHTAGWYPRRFIG